VFLRNFFRKNWKKNNNASRKQCNVYQLLIYPKTFYRSKFHISKLTGSRHDNYNIIIIIRPSAEGLIAAAAPIVFVLAYNIIYYNNIDRSIAQRIVRHASTGTRHFVNATGDYYYYYDTLPIILYSHGSCIRCTHGIIGVPKCT